MRMGRSKGALRLQRLCLQHLELTDQWVRLIWSKSSRNFEVKLDDFVKILSPEGLRYQLFSNSTVLFNVFLSYSHFLTLKVLWKLLLRQNEKFLAVIQMSCSSVAWKWRWGRLQVWECPCCAEWLLLCWFYLFIRSYCLLYAVPVQ